MPAKIGGSSPVAEVYAWDLMRHTWRMTSQQGPSTSGPDGFGFADAELQAGVRELLAADPREPLPIVEAGHPVLRSVARTYTGQLGSLLEELLVRMRQTMLAAPGVGLAAPQVGIGLAIAVIHDPGSKDANDPRERPPLAHRTIINPRYRAVRVSGGGEGDGPGNGPGGAVETCAFFEGCLSVPGYQAVTERPRAVELTCEDEAGTALREVLVGWPSRIIQHETDHLRGRLYVDLADLRTLTTYDNVARVGSRA